jgi:hypothetical protein
VLLDDVKEVARPSGGLALVLVPDEAVADCGVAEDFESPDGLGGEVLPIEIEKSLFDGLDVAPLFSDVNRRGSRCIRYPMPRRLTATIRSNEQRSSSRNHHRSEPRSINAPWSRSSLDGRSGASMRLSKSSAADSNRIPKPLPKNKRSTPSRPPKRIETADQPTQEQNAHRAP